MSALAVSPARPAVIHAEGLDKAGERGVDLRYLEGELQRPRGDRAPTRLRLPRL